MTEEDKYNHAHRISQSINNDLKRMNNKKYAGFISMKLKLADFIRQGIDPDELVLIHHPKSKLTKKVSNDDEVTNQVGLSDNTEDIEVPETMEESQKEININETSFDDVMKTNDDDISEQTNEKMNEIASSQPSTSSMAFNYSLEGKRIVSGTHVGRRKTLKPRAIKESLSMNSDRRKSTIKASAVKSKSKVVEQMDEFLKLILLNKNLLTDVLNNN